LIGTSGVRDTLVKLLKRARLLYLVTIAVGLGFVGASIAARANWAPHIAAGDELSYVFEYVTLQRTFFLVDIPLLYTLLLLLAVPALYMLHRGWTLLVLAASWGLWLVWQVSPGTVEVPWHVQDNYVLNVSSWQVLFLTGLVIGWQRGEIERLLARFSKWLSVPAMVLVIAGAAALYLVQVTAFDSLQSDPLIASLFLDKPAVPVGRLLTFALFAGAAYILVSLAWRPIQAALGWLLLPLGQNALTAYSLHVFVMLVATQILEEIFTATGSHAFLLMTSAQAACALLIWAIIVLEPKVRQLPSLAVKAWRERLAASPTPRSVGATLEGLAVQASPSA
jgi:hypothetical protein